MEVGRTLWGPIRALRHCYRRPDALQWEIPGYRIMSFLRSVDACVRKEQAYETLCTLGSDLDMRWLCIKERPEAYCAHGAA